VNEDRGPWYLLTGFVLGIAVGLFYAWIISPVDYVDTSPAELQAEYKDQYRALVALAYVYNQDFTRSAVCLGLLGDNDLSQTLTEQAQRYQAEGRNLHEAQALGLLAIAIDQDTDLDQSLPNLIEPATSPSQDLSNIPRTTSSESFGLMQSSLICNRDKLGQMYP